MKKLLLALLLSSFSLFIFAQSETILNETFEGAFPSGLWNLSGNPTWDDENYRSNSGNWAAWCAGSSMSPSDEEYADEMRAEMTYGPFSLEGTRNAQLHFASKVSSEGSYDYFKVIVKYRSGRGWSEQEIHSQDGTNHNNWQNFEYSLNDFVGNDEVKISFVFNTDGSNCEYEGAWVDDVVITKNNPAGSRDSVYQLDFTTSEISLSRNLNNSNDANWFRFRGNPDTTYYIYSSGSLDTKGYIYEDNGSTELFNDDDGGDGTNFSLTFTPSRSAHYKLKVEGYNGATGSYTLNYRKSSGSSRSTNLQITRSTQSIGNSLSHGNDENWYNFQAESGKTYVFYTEGSLDTKGYIYDGNSQLMENDDDGDGTNFRLEFLPSTSGNYRLKVVGYNGNTGSYSLHYSYQSIDVDDYEPNNSSSQYTDLEPRNGNRSMEMSLHTSDEDWFRFRGTAGTTYNFYSTGDIDTRIYLYENNGSTLISDNDDGGDVNNFSLSFTPTRTAYYKIKIEGYSGATGTYHLNYNKD